MAKTKIEWTENNWNPFYGCRRKSPGCENCYAEQIASRFSGTDKNGKVLPYTGIAQKVGGKARWTGKVKLNEEILLAPLKIKKPTIFFVNSMSDTFYSEFPDEWIDKLFAVMALCPQHTFQILTKRAKRMRDYCEKFKNISHLDNFHNWASETTDWACESGIRDWKNDLFDDEPQNDHVYEELLNAFTTVSSDEVSYLPNVWLGVSCENRANKFRLDLARETPAAITFVSLEPLIEDLGELDLRGIDWVIVGGESGSGARPCDIDWIRSIVEQCREAGAKVFVKQLGSKPVATRSGVECKLPICAPKGGNIKEFPKDLQIREMPQTKQEKING